MLLLANDRAASLQPLKETRNDCQGVLPDQQMYVSLDEAYLQHERALLPRNVP